MNVRWIIPERLPCRLDRDDRVRTDLDDACHQGAHGGRSRAGSRRAGVTGGGHAGGTGGAPGRRRHVRPGPAARHPSRRRPSRHRTTGPARATERRPARVGPRARRRVRATAPRRSSCARIRGQLVNLRLEFTVTDQIGTAPPVKKTITMNVADGESGRIRTNAEVFRKNSAPTVVPLSVDASPEIEGTRIRLRASLEYQLLKDAPEPDLPAGKTSITQSVTAILNDGVSTTLSQSADPLTDRKVTLEVKATIIK